MDHPGVTKTSALLISSRERIDSHFSTGSGEQTWMNNLEVEFSFEVGYIFAGNSR